MGLIINNAWGGGGGVTALINTKPIIGDDKPFDPTWVLSLQGSEHKTHSTKTIALAMLGANYYAQHLPIHTGSWFCWDKSCGQGPQNNFVDAEFGWINRVVKRCVFHHFWMGYLRAGQENPENTKRQHPSMKPVELMAWMMQQARVGLGKVVLDPYMGSGSTGVACVQTGRGFVGIEIDPEYYAIAKERISRTINLQKECLQFEVAEVESPA